MKTIPYLLFFILTGFSCAKPNKTLSLEEKKTIQSEVNDVMNNWHLAAAEANYKNYFSKMDSISIFIGTDAGENWSKNEFKAFSKPYFDNGKAWDFKTLERNIYTNDTGEIAWFDELLDTWMGTCRGSGVIEKKEQNWVIKHYVLSVAIPNDDIQQVIQIKQKKDSLFLTRFKQ